MQGRGAKNSYSVPTQETSTEIQVDSIGTWNLSLSAGALFTPTSSPMTFGVSLITLGFGFLGHELAHRYVARSYGCLAEFRLWGLGLVMAVVFVLASGGRIIFAAPGAVYIIPRSLGFGYGITKRENGLISLSGPLANILVGVAFLMLAGFEGLLGLVASAGVQGEPLACGFQPAALRGIGRTQGLLLEPRSLGCRNDPSMVAHIPSLTAPM